MSDNAGAGNAGAGLHRIEPAKPRSQRRYLHPLVRYGIIISGGAAVAGMTFYGLKYLGY